MADTVVHNPCVTCVHHEEKGGALSFHICDNPKYWVEDPNYVTGEVFAIRPYCYDARKSDKLCGAEGRGWEQKPYEPLAWGLLEKIRRFFR